MFAAKAGRAPLFHRLLCERLQTSSGGGKVSAQFCVAVQVPCPLCSWRKEATAVGKSGSFLFLLVSLFLPGVGPFPDGLREAQSLLAGILA